MLVLGPTLMFDVPGFLNATALLLDESNAPKGVPSRYRYKTHGALELDWGIPIGSLPLSFNGYALYIGSKGKNEFGGRTAPETHVDMNLMLDVGATMGNLKHVFLVGIEYEYWHNKFGNPTTWPGAGQAPRRARRCFGVNITSELIDVFAVLVQRDNSLDRTLRFPHER